jgi:hypothetical protein
MSARPKAYKQNAEAMEAFKRNFAERVAEIRAQLSPVHTGRGLVPDAMGTGRADTSATRLKRWSCHDAID